MKEGEEEKVDGKIGSKLSGKYLSHLARRKKKEEGWPPHLERKQSKNKKKEIFIACGHPQAQMPANRIFNALPRV